MREAIFHATVLNDIQSAIADFEPERGGILMGPIGIPAVSLFVPDPTASTTNVTYFPSSEASRRVETIQRVGILEVKGIVHSHPGSISYPSGGDHRSFGNWLRRMPWVSYLITPIVTVGSTPSGEPHQIPLRNAQMSVHVAEARAGGDVRVFPTTPRVLDIEGIVAQVATALGAVSSGHLTTHANVDGHPMAATTLTKSGGETVSVLVPYTYPLHPPLIMVPESRGSASNVRALPLLWDINVADEDRLAAALTSPVTPRLVPHVAEDFANDISDDEVLMGITETGATPELTPMLDQGNKALANHPIASVWSSLVRGERQHRSRSIRERRNSRKESDDA